MIQRQRPWQILKFGGTSVASASRWGRIEAILRARLATGRRPLVVLSAVAGVSNALEDLVTTVEEGGAAEPPIEALRARHEALGRDLGVGVEDLVDRAAASLVRWLDDAARPIASAVRAEVAAHGEWLSTRIGARWLEARGLRPTWLDARELLRAAPPGAGASDGHRYLEARCDARPDAALSARLDALDTDVVLTQGFVARDAEGRTVLLGRGGSDTAAAYLAAKVGAQGLEIWTDVPGLLSADPRVVPGARLLEAVSYDEAESLAGFGGKVLHPRTIHPVREAGIPLEVRWTEHPEGSGTRIDAAPRGEGAKAVVSRQNIGLLTVDKPAGWKPVGFLADVSACFKRHALPVDLVASSPSRIRATLDLAAPGSRDNLPALVGDIEQFAAVEVDEDVASVSVVGRSIQVSLDHLEPVLRGLGGRRLLMTSHCASDLSVTWVVPADRERTIVRLLHDTLFGCGEASAVRTPARRRQGVPA